MSKQQIPLHRDTAAKQAEKAGNLVLAMALESEPLSTARKLFLGAAERYADEEALGFLPYLITAVEDLYVRDFYNERGDLIIKADNDETLQAVQRASTEVVEELMQLWAQLPRFKFSSRIVSSGRKGVIGCHAQQVKVPTLLKTYEFMLQRIARHWRECEEDTEADVLAEFLCTACGGFAFENAEHISMVVEVWKKECEKPSANGLGIRYINVVIKSYF